MTKKSIYFGTLLLTALALGSCASDDTATDKTAGKDTPKTGTVFSSEDEPSTRTSATYTGSGLDFYWTANDKIWVKDDNNTYNQSIDDDINNRLTAAGSTTTAKAKFWVNGTYSGGTYKVRYTGKNGVQDKVTIKASQTQNTPNDAAHIAEDGDFGVADAIGYQFTLNHKAAYVTFMPYNASGVISGTKIQKIRIYTNNTSDQLAGTFDLADNGSLNNGTTTSNSVELNVNDFTIPSAYSYTTNGATMVVKPGTYTNLTIEYTLHDAVTNVTGTVKKTYSSVTFDAGKNTPIKADLKVKIYPANDYFEWDAQQHYWAGYEWGGSNPTQPVLNGESNATDAPQSTDYVSAHGLRDYNDVSEVSHPASPSHSAVNTFNTNEALWYAKEGDPHWEDILWATMGHLYKGGMWIKKQSAIARDKGKTIQQLREKAPDGNNYTTNGDICYYNSSDDGIIIPEGRPLNITDYFFLPSLGCYWKGKLEALGETGFFWGSEGLASSSAVSGACATNIRVNKSFITAANNYGSRVCGFSLFHSNTEDEYNPF